MATSKDIRAWLASCGEDAEALASLGRVVGQSAARAEIIAAGAKAAPALALLLEEGAVSVRRNAASLVGELGPDGVEAAAALAMAARHTNAPLRALALESMLMVPAPFEVYREALLHGLKRGDDAVLPVLGMYGAKALPLVRDGLGLKALKARKVAARALVEIAAEIDGAEIESELRVLLEDWDREPLQRAALEAVARLRRPPQSLAESVADLSSMPGSRRALLRFDKAMVKRELRSLILSQDTDERMVGLGIVRSYGATAAEFAELIAWQLPRDSVVQTTIESVHTLAKLYAEEPEKLADAVEPVLDHWSEEAQAVARSVLETTGAAVRSGAWEGHPFSDALAEQLQRYGFTPKGEDMLVPEERPFPEPRFAFEPAGEVGALPAQLSKAMWAFLHMLELPPHQLYTAWDEQESIHFKVERYDSDGTVLPITIDGQLHIMHPFGDGTIGFYAAVDLLDPSDDPAVFYVERWWNAGWLKSRTLSSFLRLSMGPRSS